MYTTTHHWWIYQGHGDYIHEYYRYLFISVLFKTNNNDNYVKKYKLQIHFVALSHNKCKYDGVKIMETLYSNPALLRLTLAVR